MDNDLKVIHWNCDSITNKTNELYAFINKIRADIILLSETKLNPNLNQKLKIPNFHTYRTDNPTTTGRAAYPATHPLTGPHGLAYAARDRAELFADTFRQQFSLNSGPPTPEVDSSLLTISNSFFPNTDFTTPATTEYIIKKLPIRKAPGTDQIGNSALKNLPQKILITLTNILNGCFRLGYFPDQWKEATIITIPKPGKDHTIPVNYRPIALLSSISKIFEKIILTKLKKSIGQKIRPEQFAFRETHSTVTQLVKLTDRLTINANNKVVTGAVFLDVEKAFDRVWHHGLLHKLLLLDTPISIIRIIKSFLENRTFRVKIENVSSSLKPVLSGVP